VTSRIPLTPVAEPLHRWRVADGVSLAGDSWGDPADQLVVLLHGAGQTRHSWKGTGRGLANAGFFAVAFDARGHGDSDWSPNGTYDTDIMVGDLISLVESLSASKPILIGASMGGTTSLVAIGEGRLSGAALVLVDVAPHIEERGAAEVRKFMTQNSDGFNSVEEASEAVSHYQPHRTHSARGESLAKNLRLDGDSKIRWHWDPKFMSRPRDLGERERRLSECSRRLSIPTLLIRGEHSTVLTDEGVAKFLELCPTSEFLSIAGARHMVVGDHNDLFTNSVVEFVSRTVSSRICIKTGRQKTTSE
jgi:pimeloyl-ACP methyl ester carboxylesterase